MNMMMSLAVNNVTKINNYSKINFKKINNLKAFIRTLIAPIVTIILLLFASAFYTLDNSASFAQQTNTPPILTVPSSPLALGAGTRSATGTLAVALASYVSASDREDGSLSSQIQCSSETNSLRPATNTFNFPQGTTTVACSVSDNGIRDEGNQQIPGTVLTVYKDFMVSVTVTSLESDERDEDNNGATIGSGAGGYTTDTNLRNEAASDVGKLDTTPPITRIVASTVQNNELANQRTAAFAVAGADAIGIAGYECIIDERPINPCENPVSVSGLGDGIHSFAAAAIDKAGNRDATPEQIVWEIDATAPVISGLPTQGKLPVIATGLSGGKLPVIANGLTGGEIMYTLPTATDTRDGALKVTCSPASGSKITSGVGTTGTGTCTATDLAGNIATKTFSHKVVWPRTTFPVSPIKTVDGTTKFILGSTIPVKFKVDPVPEFGYVTEIKAKIYYAKVDSVVPAGGTIVPESNLAATPGNEFRYTTSGEYIFNLGTKSITTGQGKYQITVDLGDGTKQNILISLVNPPKK